MSSSQLMDVCSQSWLWLVGWGQGLMWWMACMRDKAKGGWSHVVRCRSISRVWGDTLITPTIQSFRCLTLGRVESELFGLPWKALSRDTTRRIRFFDHAAGWRHWRNCSCPIAWCPTSKMLPARLVGSGLWTSDSLRPQTSVSTVCPRIHHPEVHLHELLKALELWKLWKAKPDLPGISQPDQLT